MNGTSIKNMSSLILVGIALSFPGMGQELPATMTKITTRIIEPKMNPDSFFAQPKTLWRAGTKYARVAEAADPQHQIHGLVIVNEPDVWMVNLFDKSGTHMVDTGPTFNAHLPIFEASSGVAGFEFGREL